MPRAPRQWIFAPMAMVPAAIAGRTAPILSAAGLALGPAALAQSGPLGEPFPGVLEARDLDGVIGLRIIGTSAGEFMGDGVAGVGDINGDGVDDLAIGAPSGSHYLGRKAGHVYVLFGPNRRATHGTPASVRVDDMLRDGRGFAIYGEGDYAFSGRRLARAGDINGDGIDDMLISGEGANPGGRSDAGEAYLIYGRAGGAFPDVLHIRTLRADQGVRIPGYTRRDRCGFSVAGAGDVNGDGVDDIIVGAPSRDSGGVHNAGAAYVVFGRPGLPLVIEPEELDGTDGFRIEGVVERGGLGVAVAIAGDLNGDGVDDLAVGAPAVDAGGVENAGAVHVIYGRDGAWPAAVSVDGLGGQQGFTLEGRTRLARVGGALAAAGDVNGDGMDDLLIGSGAASPGGRAYAGAAYILFGRRRGDPFPAVAALDDLDGRAAIRLEGVDPRDEAGHWLAAAGDVNGDGLGDVVIGANRAAQEAGESYVVFGRRYPPASAPVSVPLADLDGVNGFRVDGIERGEQSGRGVAGAGDFNGDGRADLAIGAFAADTRFSNSGDVYLIYGRDAACVADLTGDGQLTAADFLTFQNLFDAGDPRADFDGDGALTLFDFLAFQNAFDAGCE